MGPFIPCEVSASPEPWLLGSTLTRTAGRIVNMPAFLAFLDHVHSMLTNTYHNTPIVLMCSPQWTRGCIEEITQYIFEKTKTPSLCLIHSAIATQYGLRWPSMTVVDIGFEKVDVTCIFDGAVVNHRAIGVPYGDDDAEGILSGGEVFTQKLLELLKDKGFDYDKAEQLKKSNICEVLPYNPDLPERMELPKKDSEGPGFQSSGNAGADIANAGDAAQAATLEEDEAEDEVKGGEDGVLDVAGIVTSGQTKEFLAKREREKGKAGKKGSQNSTESQATRVARLPNSKRTHNVFSYEEVVQEEVPKPKPAPAPVAPADATRETATEDGAAKPEASEGEKATTEEPAKEGDDAMKVDAPESTETAEGADKAKEGEGPKETEKPKEVEGPATSSETAPLRPDSPVEMEVQSKILRTEIEVGLERFLFADRNEIDRITTLIWKTIQGIPEMYMRPACWDHIAIVGNGSRIRGLRDNIIQTLTARHLISPSSATMFTSELPSNMATPSGTGSQTPTGSFTGTPHQLPPTASGVNPLLQAATTSTLNAAQSVAAGSEAAAPPSHKFHSQTPTSIKLAPVPTYLGEWTKNGYEEAMFLGAQVAGRIAFCLHNLDGSSAEAQRKMSLSRVEYKYEFPAPGSFRPFV